jgi:uncharacterized damage-inducible protein DinB
MNGKEYFLTLFDYHYALFDRVWESILAVDEQLFFTEATYSRGSLHSQMLHMASAEIRWLGGLTGDKEAEKFNPDPADFPSRESVRALWNQHAKSMLGFLGSLEEEHLDQTYPGMRGPLWQVLTHLANHGTDHRAQILQLLHSYGAKTFNQDLIFHVWKV